MPIDSGRQAEKVDLSKTFPISRYGSDREAFVKSTPQNNFLTNGPISKKYTDPLSSTSGNTDSSKSSQNIFQGSNRGIFVKKFTLK
jgi:hypothetical protein